MKELLADYKNRKKEIKDRLQYFERVHNKSDKEIFKELCFCILTPQAKAVVCDEAVERLQKNGLLFNGSEKDIRPHLRGVRFPNNKARYLVLVRRLFKNGRSIDIKGKISTKDPFKARDWLVKNVKGFGYKEASHFLRNIGLGKDMAILDRHILKNLKRFGIIKKIPASLSKMGYIKIENRMRGFLKKINIPMEEVDLLFWSRETGMIFK